MTGHIMCPTIFLPQIELAEDGIDHVGAVGRDGVAVQREGFVEFSFRVNGADINDDVLLVVFFDFFVGGFFRPETDLVAPVSPTCRAVIRDFQRSMTMSAQAWAISNLLRAISLHEPEVFLECQHEFPASGILAAIPLHIGGVGPVPCFKLTRVPFACVFHEQRQQL